MSNSARSQSHTPPEIVENPQTETELIQPGQVTEQQQEYPDLFGMLLKFLQAPGDVLLVQGSPGTGKTTLALEILRNARSSRKVYASSRTSPTKLRQHFPFIDEVLDSMSGRVARSNWITELQDFRGQDSDNVFNKVLRLKHSRESGLMVIDSWEGALRNTTDEGRGMLESAILSELEDSQLSIVLVTEGARVGDLGHLVDGIVTLSSSEIEGRVTRSLIVNKMRGVRVPINHALFSLEGGRFSFLPYAVAYNGIGAPAEHGHPIQNTASHFSTGSSDLDLLLGGGVKRGSFVLIEVDGGVPPDGLRMLLNTMLANFLNQGGSSFAIPLGSFSSEYFAESLKPFIGPEVLEERVRIADFKVDSSARKWRVPLKGKLHEDAETFLSAWTSLGVESPKMLVVDYDRVLQVYGDDQPFASLAGIGESMRDSGSLHIGLISRHTRLREELLRAADYHLKLKSHEGSTLLFGVKPYTPIFGTRFEFNEDVPHLTLHPMV
ncbi:MAG TPA: ATPase domain-containing protein [Candidatus Binatus sp.]|nr:ATPase domain-containing protein [Candidatus Binatus sp.]